MISNRNTEIHTLYSKIDVARLAGIRLSSTYLEEAVKCFDYNLNISCITVASVLIERTLFYEKIRSSPPKAGEGLKYPNLGGLFKHFIDWDILLENLVDREERLNLELMEQRGRCKKSIDRAIYKLKYIETRNLFLHGKELLVPKLLSYLLPDNEESLSKYGIDFEEFMNPSIGTIAYIHFAKTLHFLKAYSEYIARS